MSGPAVTAERLGRKSMVAGGSGRERGGGGARGWGERGDWGERAGGRERGGVGGGTQRDSILGGINGSSSTTPQLNSPNPSPHKHRQAHLALYSQFGSNLKFAKWITLLANLKHIRIYMYSIYVCIYIDQYTVYIYVYKAYAGITVHVL